LVHRQARPRIATTCHPAKIFWEGNMKRLLIATIAAAAFLPATGTAQTMFDGTWKTDVTSIDHPAKQVVYVFKDGMFECKTCMPKVLIKFDGKDQKVEDDAYADTLAIKVNDKSHLEMIGKKKGKVVSSRKVAISMDTNSMMVEYTETSPNGQVVKGATSYARVAYDKTAPHLMSGSWKAIKEDSRSENGLLVTYKSEGKSLTMSNPLGLTYKADINGADAAVTGDPGYETVSVKVTKNVLEESFKRAGKMVASTRIQVLPNGKEAKVDWINYISRLNGNYLMKKQ
jgi:hypothetical protein